ncbi:MAG: flavodoxin family protein [Leptolyngbya sp. SIOISBB]|nr:flavodoxin family protein [Leptolyngbya sp. SIOISBB]
MRNQKIVLLDGTGKDDEDLLPVLDMLMGELQRSGATVKTFPLRKLKLGSCIGCFGCWVKTPGICVEPDAGREIAQTMIQSDIVILFTPVTFGGYSSEIKKIQDRWIPLVLPDFEMVHGEVHHQPRYARYPRLVGIGVQRQPHNAEASLFKVLVGRNALNFHAPTYAAEVVLNTDTPEQVHQQLQTALVRNDALPTGKMVKSWMSATKAPPESVAVMDSPGRALLIIGSPKVKPLGGPSSLRGKG